MSINLPRPVADYFAAEAAHNFRAVAQCFAADAVIKDEGRNISGNAAIEQWIATAQKKYQHTTEPLSITPQQGKVVVAAKVSGNFPNSPVTLNHVFGLEGDKIKSLWIH